MRHRSLPRNARPNQELAAALRSAAARASELAGQRLRARLRTPPRAGPPAPVPPLRAAAGFDAPAAALAAAEALGSAVREAIEADEERSVAAAGLRLGSRGAGGVWIAPLGRGARARRPRRRRPRRRSASREAELQLLAAPSRSASTTRSSRARRRARDARWRSASAARKQKSDEILKLSEALFAQDIELLRNNEKLGKIEKLKNDFIEKMSRELRTPLNSIIEAVISVLAGENETSPTPPRPSLRQRAERRHARSCARSRTSSTSGASSRASCRSRPRRSTSARSSRRRSSASRTRSDGKAIDIEKEIREPLPRIRTDLAKVNQILFLLLDNAVKFTPRGRDRDRGRVRRGRRARLRGRGHGHRDLPRRPAVRSSTSSTRSTTWRRTKYRGSGLGLALVRDLLILLDGEIEISSEVGQGTPFTFRIPVQVIGSAIARGVSSASVSG